MPKRKSNVEVIADFRDTHGDRYDYSETVYSNSSTKVAVFCSNHGEFRILPTHHRNGVGCSKCYFESQKMSTEEFISRSKEIWEDSFDYSLVYDLSVGSKKAQIFCKNHGIFFYQDPRNHIRGHAGCPKCKSSRLTGRRETLGSFKSQVELNEGMISKAKEIHGVKYDYSNFIYLNYETKGIIICPKHGEFLQTPGNHLKGNGCPKCSIDKIKSGTFKQKCQLLGVNYHRALKRRQAGLADEKIFSEGFIRNERITSEISVDNIKYPNIEAAMRALKPPGTSTSISRWLKEGVSPEEAFRRIPNPGYANGIIYVITNRINNKRYVGLTIQTLDRRWIYHVDQANRGLIKHWTSLHAAIRHYGPEYFTIEQLDVGTTKGNLEAKEKKWIKELDTLTPNGYNISRGGVSGGSNKKSKIVDGIRFQSVKDASEHVARTRGISLHAAKRRLLSDRIDVKTPSKAGESFVKTKVYRAWSYIIQCVLNPRSKYHIPEVTICVEWKDFQRFKADVGDPENKTLVFSRLDRSKGFYQENCAWLTRNKFSQIVTSHLSNHLDEHH